MEVMYMEGKITSRLINFIEKSPTAYHAVNTIKEQLLDNGYEELLESENWSLNLGGNYFVTRGESSIIAFKIGENLEDYAFNIVATHSDSPMLKIKPNPEMTVGEHYVKLNVEGYGYMIYSTWLDRQLSIAGRVVIKNNDIFESKLVNFEKPVCVIPSQAIHINWDANIKMEWNPQIDLLPLFREKSDNNDSFDDILLKHMNLDSSKNKIYDYDLFLYNNEKGCTYGYNDEFILAPRLDDLQSTFAALEGIQNSENKETVNVFACFDNEEVGSKTKQGAASTFLVDTLIRINEVLGKSKIEFHKALKNSFIVSADNAHAVHPNHEEKNDPTNKVYLNRGLVIKYHAAQYYTTDAMTASIFKSICESVDAPYQMYTVKSDLKSGWTLGLESSTQLSINSVDVGLPQLAMHSANETAGVKDTEYLYKALVQYYQTKMKECGGMKIKVN